MLLLNGNAVSKIFCLQLQLTLGNIFQGSIEASCQLGVFRVKLIKLLPSQAVAKTVVYPAFVKVNNDVLDMIQNCYAHVSVVCGGGGRTSSFWRPRVW